MHSLSIQIILSLYILRSDMPLTCQYLALEIVDIILILFSNDI